MAIIAFENLSSNSNLNWTGRAAASALVYDLAPASDVHALMVDSVSGALASPASEMLQAYFSERNGRLRLSATVEDLRRARTVDGFELDGPAADGVLPLVNQLARRINDAARQFGTNKLEAFRAYGEALQARDAQAKAGGLESAVKLDPRFAAAYIEEARLLFTQGQREQGLKVLETARSANPDAIDSAEIDLLTASVSGDTGGRTKALEALTRLTPAVDRWFKELANVRLSQRQFQEAVQSYEAAARLAPDEADIWNQMGYAYAYAQDLASARRSLEHYEQMLGPANANALDSLGEVSFFLGDFRAAERYFLEAQEKNGAQRGAELVKAAQARLMTGDLAGADGIFQRYLALAQPAQRNAAGFEQAQWEFLTGRRKSGMARLEKLIPTLSGDQEGLALCQLAIWKLQTGARSEAVDLAGKAAAMAGIAGTAGLSALVRAMATGSASLSSPLGDAYVLLVAGKYDQALPLLEKLYRETNPTVDGQIRTLLALADVATKRIAEATPLVQTYPIPLSSGDAAFASLIFPRFLSLRSVVLENGGRNAEAKRCLDLFRKYSGDTPDALN